MALPSTYQIFLPLQLLSCILQLQIQRIIVGPVNKVIRVLVDGGGVLLEAVKVLFQLTFSFLLKPKMSLRNKFVIDLILELQV